MNIWTQAGARLSHPGRCLRANYSTLTTSLKKDSRKPERGSAAKSTERVVHPPFDLSLQSKVSSIVRNSSKRFKGSSKKKYQPVVSASETAIARGPAARAQTIRVLNDAIIGRPPLTKAQARKLRKKKAGPITPPGASPKSSSSISLEGGPIAPTSEWVSERWIDSWGEDKLKPTVPTPTGSWKGRGAPPHLPRHPFPYTRRIEGLLEPTDGSILQDLPPPSEHQPIATLAHGLERVLFNPGVHWLQDPRSRVYNFTPWLENIPKVTDFAFERLPGFIKSSRDEDLWTLAKREGRTFAGSTSSLSGMLSQIYFLISADKDVDTSVLSHKFRKESTNFTPGQRMPASVVMNYNDSVYSIDSGSDKESHTDKNILTWMGTLLEKFVTMSPEKFATYMRSSPSLIKADTHPMREAYRYAKSDRFVMRSQLDCHDARLPGTGVFDIKTRACLPIRMDILNFEENSGYTIDKQYGLFESFEREYYDLIRSAFLKYSFQARIGNMDGVIVAYHNTARMFGFQYIPLEEMDARLFGPGKGAGDQVFHKCIGLLEAVADEVIRCFPEQSVQCIFETEERKNTMNVWVEPAVWYGEGERPIKQLEVKAESYLSELPVKGYRAVSVVDEPWTLHWSVSRLAEDERHIREKLQAAKNRQFRAYSFPAGVDAENMAKFWHALNFSGKIAADDEDPAVYRAENFKTAGHKIEQLRELARSGRKATEQLAREEAGKPKFVLGKMGTVTNNRPRTTVAITDDGSSCAGVVSTSASVGGDMSESASEIGPDLAGGKCIAGLGSTDQTIDTVEPARAPLQNFIPPVEANASALGTAQAPSHSTRGHGVGPLPETPGPQLTTTDEVGPLILDASRDESKTL